jgi:hypothetical protein
MTRVERAWLKYQLATTPARKDRWQFAYLAAMSADKAIKAVAEVRGIAAPSNGDPLPVEAPRVRYRTSDEQSTTNVSFDTSARGLSP